MERKKGLLKSGCGFIVLFTVLLFFASAQSSLASSTVWDSARQLLMVRGIGIMNSGSPQTYWILLGNPDFSQGTLIMELLEAGVDNISDDAIYYPEERDLNFMLELDGTTYDIWMKLYQGNSGRIFLVLTDIQTY